MTPTTATLPERAGTRSDARQLVGDLGTDLEGSVVHLDASQLVTGSSSFMDELVKELLEVHQARLVVLDGVTARSAAFARSSAERRGVADRLDTVVRF